MDASLPAPPAGLEAMCEVLPGQPLLVGSQLEVLRGQFEAQRVGSQRVDHVLVAFSPVLHQERTPVGLRGADQLQTLQDKRQNRAGFNAYRAGALGRIGGGLLSQQPFLVSACRIFSSVLFVCLSVRAVISTKRLLELNKREAEWTFKEY